MRCLSTMTLKQALISCRETVPLTQEGPDGRSKCGGLLCLCVSVWAFAASTCQVISEIKWQP